MNLPEDLFYWKSFFEILQISAEKLWRNEDSKVKASGLVEKGWYLQQEFLFQVTSWPFNSHLVLILSLTSLSLIYEMEHKELA